MARSPWWISRDSIGGDNVRRTFEYDELVSVSPVRLEEPHPTGRFEAKPAAN